MKIKHTTYIRLCLSTCYISISACVAACMFFVVVVIFAIPGYVNLAFRNDTSLSIFIGFFAEKGTKDSTIW